MIITNSGRPVDRFPFFILRDGGKWLLTLSRIDVSDVGNITRAEAFYEPLVVVEREDQMTNVEFRLGKNVLVIFIAPKKWSWHLVNQETEQ